MWTECGVNKEIASVAGWFCEGEATGVKGPAIILNSFPKIIVTWCVFFILSDRLGKSIVIVCFIVMTTRKHCAKLQLPIFVPLSSSRGLLFRSSPGKLALLYTLFCSSEMSARTDPGLMNLLICSAPTPEPPKSSKLAILYGFIRVMQTNEHCIIYKLC